MTEETPIRPTLEEQCRELVEEWRDKRQTEELQEAHIEVAEMCNELEAILDE